MPCCKSSGKDNIPIDIFKNSTELCSILLACANNTFQGNQPLPESLCSVFFRLIPKDPDLDSTNLDNYRPIGLLPMAYRIMSKAITNRLQPMLTRLIGPHQYAYVNGIINIPKSLLNLWSNTNDVSSIPALQDLLLNHSCPAYEDAGIFHPITNKGGWRITVNGDFRLLGIHYCFHMNLNTLKLTIPTKTLIYLPTFSSLSQATLGISKMITYMTLVLSLLVLYTLRQITFLIA